MQESGGLLFHLVVYIHRSSFLVRRCEGSEEKRDVSSDHCAGSRQLRSSTCRHNSVLRSPPSGVRGPAILPIGLRTHDQLPPDPSPYSAHFDFHSNNAKIDPENSVVPAIISGAAHRRLYTGCCEMASSATAPHQLPLPRAERADVLPLKMA